MVDRATAKVRIIDVPTRTLLSAEIILTPVGEPLLEPVAIEARTDGKRVFVAELGHATVGMAGIDLTDQFTLHRRLEQAYTGAAARRLVLLRLPQ